MFPVCALRHVPCGCWTLRTFLRMTWFCWLLLSVTSSRHRGGFAVLGWVMAPRGLKTENCRLPPLVGWWAPAPLCWTIAVKRELSQKANFGFHHSIYIPVIVHTSGKCVEMSFLRWFGGRPRSHWTEGCPEYPARPATCSFSQVLIFGNWFVAAGADDRSSLPDVLQNNWCLTKTHLNTRETQTVKCLQT